MSNPIPPLRLFLFPPKSSAVLFVLQIVLDDTLQQKEVNRFVPLNAKEIASPAIS